MIKANNNEVVLGDEDLIVSKTDLKGRITYINRTFMSISGFPEKALIGHQHNVIRHPDMPRGVFHKMWQELKSEQEFFGYVKNLCADGSYYWVFANVTPDFDQQGTLRGYYSVRRKPNPSAVSLIKDLYQKMRSEENSGDRKTAPLRSWAIIDEYLKQHNVSYNRFMIESDDTKEAC
ncbi:MAG: PAS domain-containing protein [Cellvibrionaceae bacterium]|nr:PAS domain-containing protein [Cellvibrionaceae bacterium]MCV6628175.1 PAS domain-containing protein [Cellvibrionaceae bacterium]